MNQYLGFDEPVTVNLAGQVYRFDPPKAQGGDVGGWHGHFDPLAPPLRGAEWRPSATPRPSESCAAARGAAGRPLRRGAAERGRRASSTGLLLLLFLQTPSIMLKPLVVGSTASQTFVGAVVEQGAASQGSTYDVDVISPEASPVKTPRVGGTSA